VFTQVIRPGTKAGEVVILVLAMVATSAVFWLAFVYTLHLPAVRGFLGKSRRAVEGVFGALLLLLGLRIATRE
jgi:threonine/homoserine/homoserine lactone efflux protein